MSIQPEDDQPQRPDHVRGESGLIQRTRQFLRSSFPDHVPHIVVGYSGGNDSLALLLVGRELQRLGACDLTAVHIDHGLRSESAEDARQVMRIAEKLGVRCMLKTAPEDLRQAFPGQSVEDVARRFRYQSLAQVLNDVDGDAIAVAHHRRDQAETVLLHLLRGSGLSGLRGMVPDSMLAVSGEGGTGSEPGDPIRVIRPFLHEDPAVLDDVARRSGVAIVEDPSNYDPGFRRNRIRHELLPLMEDIASGATGRLVSLADILHADDEALEDVAHALVHRTVDERGSLGWEAVRSAPVGLQRRVVRHWILHSGLASDLSRERVDAVVELAGRNEGGKQVEIGVGWRVRYAQGHLELIPPDSDA